MIPAMRSLIALQDRAIGPTARLAAGRMIAPEVPAAVIRARAAAIRGFCRKQRPQKIRTSFSRQWTGPGFLQVAMALEIGVAMEVLAVVVAVAQTVQMAQMVEGAVAAALAVRRAPGSGHPAAMFRGNKHPDEGMTGVTGITGVIKPPISQIR